MTTKYLKHFPKPLLDDLVAGRWLPIVGAGLSRNADLPSRRTMPLWTDLGKSLAEDMQDYEYVNPIDAISAYAHEFGRPKLIEKLSDLLFVSEARPGKTHHAFCSIQFDIVCTTNLDFLLERQYELTPRPCTPLIDEDQLSIKVHGSSVTLLKLHGDLNHPNRLVATEEDYDIFLERYPSVATYLANLLITRTAVLIGYSLDDPDFRQVWQVVGERLGKARRVAYVLCVGAKPADVTRFERRGVKVINLPGNKSKYGEILSEAFDELKNYWRDKIVLESHVVAEEPLLELSLPRDSVTRLCFFALPLSVYPFYRKWVFPLVREVGLVPMTADEIISPGENIVAKIEALIFRSFLVVVDASSEFTLAEARMSLGRNEPGRLCVIIEEGASIPAEIQRTEIFREPDLASEVARLIPIERQRITILRRPDLASVEVGQFLNELQAWLQEAVDRLGPSLSDEPQRLLRAREYRAAVISAITNFEATLEEKLEASLDRSGEFMSSRGLLHAAVRENLLTEVEVRKILKWRRIRNEVVHRRAPVLPRTSREIVSGVEEITDRLRR